MQVKKTGSSRTPPPSHNGPHCGPQGPRPPAPGLAALGMVKGRNISIYADSSKEWQISAQAPGPPPLTGLPVAVVCPPPLTPPRRASGTRCVGIYPSL